MLESSISRYGEKTRKYSKNKKKNWRKFSKVKDVEHFLEEKRREENLGSVVRSRERICSYDRLLHCFDTVFRRTRKRTSNFL